MLNELVICNGRGPWIAKGKRILLNLAGGDILGLTSNTEFIRAFFQFLQNEDIFNYQTFAYEDQPSQLLLNTLCNFKGQQKAILFKDFPSLLNLLCGYLLKKGYTLLFDEQFNGVITQLMRNFTQKVQFFQHNSFSTIKKLFESHPEENFAVFIQTVYPLSSELLPIQELLEISEDDRIHLTIYESWADGLLGEAGEGLSSLSNTLPQNSIILGTFSHLLPFSASYIASSELFLSAFEAYLKELSFTSRPSEFQISITIWFINFLKSVKSPLRKLNDNASYLRYEFASKGFKVMGDFTPLIPILIGERDKTLEFYNALLENKILVNLLNFPIVPLGKSRILLIPSSLHSKEDLDFALNKIEKIAQSLGII